MRAKGVVKGRSMVIGLLRLQQATEPIRLYDLFPIAPCGWRVPVKWILELDMIGFETGTFSLELKGKGRDTTVRMLKTKQDEGTTAKC